VNIRENRHLYFTLLLVAGIFLIDIFIVTGYAIAFLYILPLFIILKNNNKLNLVTLISISSLTFVAIPFKDIMVPLPFVLYNRIIALIVFSGITYTAYLRNKLQKKLQQSEERYKHLIDNTMVGVFQASLDGKILYLNETIIKMMAFESREEATTHFDRDFIKDPAQRELLSSRLKEQGFIRNQDIEIINTRGELKHVIFSAAVGSDRIITGVLLDITERKEAEDNLHRKEEEISTLADNSSDIIVRFDRTAHYLYTNKFLSTVKGIPKEKIMGKKMSDLDFPEELARTVETAIEEVFEKRTSAIKEIPFNTDHKITYFQMKFIPEFDKDGKTISVLAIGRDITELKKAEVILQRDKETLERHVQQQAKALIKTQEELFKANRLADLGSLSATVAHELRNPLAAIELARHNISRKTTEKEKLWKHLQTIEKKITESNQIIDNLLHFAKIKLPALEPTDLYHLIKEIEEGAKGKYNRPGVKMKDNIPAQQTLLVEIDPTQIKEIFNNVINNAFDACLSKESPGDHAMIEIQVLEENNQVITQVKDNGIGIDKVTMKRLFEPFFSTKSKGTGLGLAISKQIIENHQGSIQLDSKKGQGTTVKIILPRKH
jgi:two-component system sporulation sensor kinase A